MTVMLYLTHASDELKAEILRIMDETWGPAVKRAKPIKKEWADYYQ